MPPLNDFIATLTQEQAKLVQIGAIKRSMNQTLAAIDAPKSSGRDKQKGKGKFNESKKERPVQSSAAIICLRVRRRRKEHFAAIVPKVFISNKIA